MKLTDFKALAFDCYGTLIDWESGMIEALKPLTGKLSRALSRDGLSKRMRGMSCRSRSRRRLSPIVSCWRSSIAGWPRNGAFQ